MAIETTLVASGTLVEAVYQSGPNPYPVTMHVTARDSKWFESHAAGSGEDQGKGLAVSIALNAMTLFGSENLAVELFTSEDLLDWGHLATLVDSGTFPNPPIATTGIYEATYSYGSDPVLEYLRLLFTIDENQNVPFLALPYPQSNVKLEGSCWVTVYR